MYQPKLLIAQNGYILIHKVNKSEAGKMSNSGATKPNLVVEGTNTDHCAAHSTVGQSEQQEIKKKSFVILMCDGTFVYCDNIVKVKTRYRVTQKVLQGKK